MYNFYADQNLEYTNIVAVYCVMKIYIFCYPATSESPKKVGRCFPVKPILNDFSPKM